MYRQFVKMTRVKAINNGMKAAKEYIGGDIENVINVIEADSVLAKGTKDNLVNLLQERELSMYPVKNFLIDRFYVTSVVESYDERTEFVVIKILLDVIGIDLFRTDKRVYKSYNGEYVTAPMVYDLVNVKFRTVFDANEYSNISERKIKNIANADKNIKLEPKDFSIMNDNLDLVYADIENLKIMANGINEDFSINLPIVKDDLIKYMALSENPLHVKDVDFSKRSSINTLETDLEVFGKSVKFKEIVLDNRLHVIVAQRNEDVMIIPTVAVGNVSIKDPILLGTLLQYYKLRDVGLKYCLIGIEGVPFEEDGKLSDNKRAIRTSRESVGNDVRILADKWNFSLGQDETIFRKQCLK